MTLILGVLTREYVMLAADRRLTSVREGSRQIVDESADKLFAQVKFDDAVIAVAFSGLARIGNFNTSAWLQTNLLTARDPDNQLFPSLERLAAAATGEFKSNPEIQSVAAAERRLVIAVVGYMKCEGKNWFAVERHISNFHPPGKPESPVALDKFGVEPSRVLRRSPDACVVGCGDLRGLHSKSPKRLCNLASRRMPLEKLRGELVGLIQTAARSPKSEGTIGTDVFTTSMTRAQAITTMVTKPSPTGGLILEAPPTMVPSADAFVKLTVQTPRFTSGTGLGEPCGCGSGKLTRDCHPPR